MKTLLILVGAILLAFFMPLVALVAGVLMMIFNQQLDPNGGCSGTFNFQGIIPLFGGLAMVIMSLLVLAVRFFG